MTRPGAIEAAFSEHRRFLWGLSYRMTGDGAEAEDVVMEAFRRAVEAPPPDLEASLRPWLARVTTRLSIDALRRRKTRAYKGPWLPAPIETPADEYPLDVETPEDRYGLLESVTMAFLVALEELTGDQRAVLVLRDVLDLSVRETADAANMTEANVRVTHHRARAKMAAYDAHRTVPSEALRAQATALVGRFMAALAIGDADELRAVLAEDVITVNDANGEFIAAAKVVVGRDRVVRFYEKVQELRVRMGSQPALAFRLINGMPAVLSTFSPSPGRYAPRGVTWIRLDPHGRIGAIEASVAEAKLRGVRSWES